MHRVVLRITALTFTLLMALTLLGANSNNVFSSARPSQPQTAEVKIDNFNFSPADLTVPVGTTVTWVNRDDIPHNVVSSDDPNVFKSKALDTDDKFSFTFIKAGSYPYFCSIHPKMTGKVVAR